MVNNFSQGDKLSQILSELVKTYQGIEKMLILSINKNDSSALLSGYPINLEGLDVEKMSKLLSVCVLNANLLLKEFENPDFQQIIIQALGYHILIVKANSNTILISLSDNSTKLGLLMYDLRVRAKEIKILLETKK